MSDLADTARSIVRDLDPTNQLTFLRVKSVKHEVGIEQGEVAYGSKSVVLIFLLRYICPQCPHMI